MTTMPADLIDPLPDFAERYAYYRSEGLRRLKVARVAFVGLARNCAAPLAANLARLEQLVTTAAGWRLHIETNDNADATDQVLMEFCRIFPHATFTSRTLSRPQYGAEFAGRRTIALAEYRTDCQRWVAECARDCDYVAVVDWDAKGGFVTDGFLAALGELVHMPGAAGMAAVSLVQLPVQGKPEWLHYDAWALRLNSPWDDYTRGVGAWKHMWLPPVGSPPVRVASAFGGLAIYCRDAYLAGTYRGDTDCEHVSFHDTILRATTQGMYLCPSLRTIMDWCADARPHGDH
ncbi:MAG: hypothetical protein EBR82_78860 [Caulobacteraceae bacterium]|nr:hypothetical protein [Caulobacteraceae bacterium]